MNPRVVGNVVELSTPHPSHNIAALAAELQQMKIRLFDLDERIAGALAHAPTAETVRSSIAARRRRTMIFGSLFGDPPWDILLELYSVALEQQRISISKLCDAAGVPGTTGLRWIDKLQSEGLVIRRADPMDGRRFWIELSDKGLAAMHQYFAENGRGPLPADV